MRSVFFVLAIVGRGKVLIVMGDGPLGSHIEEGFLSARWGGSGAHCELPGFRVPPQWDEEEGLHVRGDGRLGAHIKERCLL